MRGLLIFVLGLVLGAFVTWGIGTALEQAAEMVPKCQDVESIRIGGMLVAGC